MPIYQPGVQASIEFIVRNEDGTPYTTSGTPPTITVVKNFTGTGSSAAGTMAYLAGGVWRYTPSAGEVSGATNLTLIISGSGIMGDCIPVPQEADYTTAAADLIKGAGDSGLALSSEVSGVKTDTSTLTSRLTSTRAGYLDSLNTGVPLSSSERTTLAGVIWGIATSALTTAGTIGKALVDLVTRGLLALPAAAAGASAGLARVQDLSGGGGGGSAYGVPLIRCTVGGDGLVGHISVINGDDKTVSIWFTDDDGSPVAMPAGDSASLLNAAGTAVGTATITDSKASVGYFLVRLEVTGSPVKLRLTFDGGDGYTYSHDVPVRSVS